MSGLLARIALLFALLFAVWVGAARANGDPASHVLVGQNVFLPFPPPSDSVAAALMQEVAAVYSQHAVLKVAVIASPNDLGTIPSLFNMPSLYAKLLGFEIQFAYSGPLLIIMPSGYGISQLHRPTTRAQAVLDTLRSPGVTADELTASAAVAVRSLLQTGALLDDAIPPTARPLHASGKPGHRMRLPYRVSDDNGRASVLLQVVTRSGRVLVTFKRPIRTVAPATTYYLTWQVPSRLRPQVLLSCIIATDPSGNHSKRVCASISLT